MEMQPCRYGGRVIRQAGRQAGIFTFLNMDSGDMDIVISRYWLNLRFSLALTICESKALFFVSSWCSNLIRVFFHDDTLH